MNNLLHFILTNLVMQNPLIIRVIVEDTDRGSLKNTLIGSYTRRINIESNIVTFRSDEFRPINNHGAFIRLVSFVPFQVK